MITNERKESLRQFLDGLQIHIDDYALVHQALIHPSYITDKAQFDSHNQRLEFLGDAVVDLLVGEYLYHNFPKKTEGELSRMRAALVCESALAAVARRNHLGDYLLIGKGEKNSGGAQRSSNLADAWEALIGALYLLIPLKDIATMLIRELSPEIELVQKGYYGDYKTQLQEYIQRNPGDKVYYQILEEIGPDHNKEFTAGVYINDVLTETGKGRTKKEAEQNGALAYLLKLGEING